MELDTANLAVSAVAALGSVFGGYFAFRAFAANERDRNRPCYILAVLDPPDESVVFVNPRPSQVTILAAHIDVFGDSFNVVPVHITVGNRECLPYRVPSGTAVRLHSLANASDKVAINVQSRLVISLSTGDTASSPDGMLWQIHDKAAARKIEHRA